MADFARVMGRLLRLDDDLPTIDLTGSLIGDDGITALANALVNNTSVTELYLPRNDIGDEGAVALAAALSMKTDIVVLSLADNNIGPVGCSALAAALQHNSSIIKLNLNLNRIGDVGMIALSAVLSEDTCRMTKLELAQNGIGRQGATALIAALRHNTCLTMINFLRNVIDNELRSEIYNLVAVNRASYKHIVKRSVYPILNKMADVVLPSALAKIGRLPPRFALSTMYRFVREINLAEVRGDLGCNEEDVGNDE